MDSHSIYSVHVGKNVISLKGYHNPKVPKFLMVAKTRKGGKARRAEHENIKIEAQTSRPSFEFPFVIILLGLLGCLACYMFLTWDNAPPYVRISLGALSAIGGLVGLIYGLGSITQQKGFHLDSSGSTLWSRFFWITRKQDITNLGPEFLCCTATQDRQENTCYHFDICLHYKMPAGMISIFQLDGYSKIPVEKGAQWKAYEMTMMDIHEKAIEMARELNLEFRPNFGPGPMPDVLKKLLDQAAPDDSEDELDDVEVSAEVDEEERAP